MWQILNPNSFWHLEIIYVQDCSQYLSKNYQIHDNFSKHAVT